MSQPMNLTVDGLTLSISNWAERTGLVHQVIRWRMRAGWTPEQCVGLAEPPKRGSREVKIRANGNYLSIPDWSAITGIGRQLIYNRYVHRKWSAEEALGFRKRVTNRPSGPIKRPKTLTEFNGVSLITKTIEIIDSEAIGRIAKTVRIAAGLSRDQAADALKMNPYNVYRLERGEQEWNQETLNHFNEVAKGWVQNVLSELS